MEQGSWPRNGEENRPKNTEAKRNGSALGVMGDKEGQGLIVPVPPAAVPPCSWWELRGAHGLCRILQIWRETASVPGSCLWSGEDGGQGLGMCCAWIGGGDQLGMLLLLVPPISAAPTGSLLSLFQHLSPALPCQSWCFGPESLLLRLREPLR